MKSFTFSSVSGLWRINGRDKVSVLACTNEHAFRIQNGISLHDDAIKVAVSSSNLSPAIEPTLLIIATAAPRARGIRYSSGTRESAACSTPSIDSTENHLLE